MTGIITRRAALAGLSALAVAPAIAQTGAAGGRHHHRPRLHPRRQRRSDRASRRRAARREARPPDRGRAEARRRRHRPPRPMWRAPRPTARRLPSCPADTRCRLRSTTSCPTGALEDFSWVTHAVGFSLRVRRPIRIIRRKTSPISSAWRRRRRASCSAPRRATAPASISRSNCSRRPPGSRCRSCRIAARRRPRPICSASASMRSWTT